MEWFLGLSPVMQAFLGTCFTWFLTGLGASVVFFFKNVNRKVMDKMLRSAAGGDDSCKLLVSSLTVI